MAGVSGRDRDWLLAMLAMARGLVRAEDLQSAGMACADHPGQSVVELLIERGQLSMDEQSWLDDELDRALKETRAETRPPNEPTEGLSDPEITELVTIDFTVGQMPPKIPLPKCPAPTAGAPRIGRYELLKLHAQGGIGQVWLARDTHLGRMVALKVLRPDRLDHEEMRARFGEEARITGQLTHPGIVPVYELVEETKQGGPYYTMRFVRGRTLAETLRAMHNLSERDRLALRGLLGAFVASCNAVAYAHRRGVLHRDLKSSNIVLGDFGEVLVVDWGLAKLRGDGAEPEVPPDHLLELEDAVALPVGHDETLAGRRVGTPAYMAPEQAGGDIACISRRTDVYSLGAILYEILVGRPPYTGGDADDITRQVLEYPPKPPRAADPRIARGLEAICLKALARQPEERYADARALALDIERWLADEPTTALPEAWYHRLARWTRRHREVVRISGALLVLLVVVLGVAVVLIQQRESVADQSQRVARAAIQQILSDEAIEGLAQIPAFDDVRRRTIAAAVTRYAQLVALRPDDPELLREAAEVHVRAGVISRGLGNPMQAESYFRIALRQLAQSQSLAPNDVEVAFRHTIALVSLADTVLESCKPDEAPALVAKALILARGLASRHPEDGRFRHVLASVLSTRAALREGNGDIDAARDDLGEALELLRRLVADEPAQRAPGDRSRLLLLLVLLRRSGSDELSGGPDAAAGALGEAERLADQLIRERPEDQIRRYFHAWTQCEIVRRRPEPPEVVEARLARAIDNLEALRRDYPSAADYIRHLGDALLLRGEWHARAGRLDLADDDYRAAETCWATDPERDRRPMVMATNRARALFARARLYRDQGRIAEAITLLETALGGLEQAARRCPGAPSGLLDDLRAELGMLRAMRPGAGP
jgi:tetratricopeptide (TPR) repeat protein/tRNA A-37 threonylcarbamoyl transferase component Bud32